MSEPTIEDVISHEYWEEQYPIEYTGRTPSLCVDVVEITLLAVLRELRNEINSAHDIQDLAFRTCKFRNRLSAILGEHNNEE